MLLGPGPIQTEMVGVKVDIEVKVGEESCEVRSVWSEGGSGWLALEPHFASE